MRASADGSPRARIHRWFVEYWDGGAVVGRVLVDPEWGPAVEAARLAGIRRGLLPAVTSGGRWTIEPRWHEASGAPWVASVVATLRVDEATVSTPIPFAYFATPAASGLATLVADGWRGETETLRYLVGAEPSADDLPPPRAAAGELVVETVPCPLRLGTARLADLVPGTVEPPDRDEDVPVVIAPEVIETARRRAAADRMVETGGFLLGRVHRDASRDDLVIAVTDLVPAEHTTASRGRLTFTPETWCALHDRLDERGGDAVVTGWMHDHPFQCRDCPRDRWAACPFATPVFSADDVALHAACFTRAWNVALLLSERDTGSYDINLFGWRHGLVAERRFYLAGRRPADERIDHGPTRR